MKKFIPLFLSAILLTGCSSNGYLFGDGWSKSENADAKTSKAQPDERIILASENYNTPTRPFLLNTGWQVTYVNNKKVNPQYSFTLYFRNNIFNQHDFLISGKSGCNSYQGNASLEIMESKIVADSNYMSTQLYCADANLEAIEKKFLDVIFDNKRIEKNGEKSIVLKHYNDTFILEKM